MIPAASGLDSSSTPKHNIKSRSFRVPVPSELTPSDVMTIPSLSLSKEVDVNEQVASSRSSGSWESYSLAAPVENLDDCFHSRPWIGKAIDSSTSTSVLREEEKTEKFDSENHPVDNFLPETTVQLNREFVQRASRDSLGTSQKRWCALGLMVVVIAQFATVAVIFGYTYTILDGGSDLHDLSGSTLYMTFFIVANLFAVILAIDTLLHQNLAQLIALCLFNMCMTVYAMILTTQLRALLSTDDSRVFKIQMIAVPATTGISSVFLMILTYYLSKEFEWDMFKQIGANLQLQSASRLKCVFFMLQKFNIFFLIGFSLQRVVLSEFNSNRGVIFSTCAIVLSFAILIFATIAVEREISWMMCVYHIVWLPALIYMCYTVGWSKNYSLPLSRSLIFSIPTIVILLVTGILATFCWRNFGKGLKDSRTPSAWHVALRATRKRAISRRISME